jgi:ABC-type polysaccharide/polyol phosphate export permease
MKASTWSLKMFEALADMAVGLGQWRTSYRLGLQDIELRYKRSLLGPFWISAALVATILALAFVFSGVFRTNFGTYVAYIGAGLLTWQLILALVNEACGAVAEHTYFLQNIPLPITTIAGRIMFRNAVVFLHHIVAVCGLLFLFGVQFTPMIVWALPGAGLILLIGYFSVMLLGPVCARFRDVPLVISSVMQVLFFLTPIFWMPAESTHHPAVVYANPFYHLIELVRAPLLGRMATELNWTFSLWCCAAFAVLAVVSWSLTRKRIALWI